MNIHFEDFVAVFCLTEEDIETAFDADINGFLTIMRADPSPCVDFSLGIHESLTGFVADTGTIRLIPMNNNGQTVVLTMFYQLENTEGQIACYSNMQGANVMIDPDSLSILTDKCGVKMDTSGLEPDEENEEDEESGSEEDTVTSTVYTDEINTDWVFHKDPDAEDDDRSIKNIAIAMMRGLVPEEPADMPSIIMSGISPENGENAPKDTSKEEKHASLQTKRVTYRFLDYDAAIGILGNNKNNKIYNYPHEIRIFENKDRKLEIYMTITYSSKQEQVALEYQLTDYVAPARVPRGEVISI